MAEADRIRWDERYVAADRPIGEPALPEHFEPFAEHLATATRAIEIACGAGRASVWLALQGVEVVGYDVSPVAIAQASQLALDYGVSERCTFEATDLDQGLPPGPPVDLVLCNMFRSSALDQPVMDRLLVGGVLAVAVLSKVGADPQASTRFRAEPGELADAFSSLTMLHQAEGNGTAWLVACR